MMTGRMAMATIMYTLPISNFRKSALRSWAIRMGRVFFVGGVQYKRRNEVVVPACHEGEDSLHSQRRLHDGQHDLIKGIKFACAVNAGSLHDLHGKGGIQILLHEEEHGGCRNAGNDQRDEAVFTAPSWRSTAESPVRTPVWAWS